MPTYRTTEKFITPMESGGRWGEAVCDFFACLMQHSKDRALERKSLYYWVCAYANNQWNVSDEIGALDHLFSCCIRIHDLQIFGKIFPQSLHQLIGCLTCNGLWFNNLEGFEITAVCQQERIHPIVASDVPCEKLRELFPLWTKMPSAIRGSAIFADSQGNSQKDEPQKLAKDFCSKLPLQFCLGDFVDLLMFMKFPHFFPFLPPVKSPSNRRVWCIYETYVSTLEQRAHQGAKKTCSVLKTTMTPQENRGSWNRRGFLKVSSFWF